MLRGILYDIVSSNAAGATLRLLPDSPVYQGHFPGYPITPGVCLVEIAIELIEMMAGPDAKVRLAGAKSIKFTSPVIPEAGKELRYNLSGEGSTREVEVLYGDVLSAKMSLSVE